MEALYLDTNNEYHENLYDPNNPIDRDHHLLPIHSI